MLKEMLKAKKAELAALKSKIEAGDAEAIKQGEALMKEIGDIAAKIELAEKKAALLGVIGEKNTGEDHGDGDRPAKNLGENFTRRMKAAKPNRGEQFTVAAPAFAKAASDIQMSPAGAVDFATTFDRNVVTAPRTDLVIRDLFGSERISGSTLTYLVEGAQEGEAAVVAEGAQKPQIHFADPTPVTVSLDKIAAYIKESDEYIDDYPFLESAINGRLLYALGLKTQSYLIEKLLAANIGTDTVASGASATAIAEKILQAAMGVQTASGYAADAIVLNPTVWFKLRTARVDGDKGAYFGGGFFGAQNVPNLWGIPVAVTSAVTASQIIVGAFRTCGSVVSRDGVSVAATNSNEADFIHNLMAIRAEERLALAVRRPAGFKLITVGE
jgi:HK97 family phage major capsid protein